MKLTKKINTALLYISIGIGLSSPVVTAAPYAKTFAQYQQQYAMKHAYTTHLIPREQYTLHAREFAPQNGPTHAGIPTIIMLHGFPDSQILYDKLAPKLARHYRVITFDFLGWGMSDTPTDYAYNVNQLTADLNTVVETLALKNVVLVMHDLSGLPAIDWSLQHPDRVSGLILLNTFYGPMQSLNPPEAIQFYASPNPLRTEIEQVVTKTDFLWLGGFENQVAKFFHRPKIRDTYLKLFTHQSLQIRPAFLQLTASLFDDVSDRAIAQYTLLPQMQIPVSIIFGQNDPYITPEVAQEFHQLFAQSQLHLVEDAGHYVQLDQPGAVSDLITSFIQSQ